jgi:hypothetical protein
MILSSGYAMALQGDGSCSDEGLAEFKEFMGEVDVE